MKISIDVDATPEELRRFIGLPDLQPLQDELLNSIRERMHAGQEGYDPVTLMKPFLPGAHQNMEAFQKLFWDAFRQQGDAMKSPGGKQGGKK
ncbi:hypothetical protein J2T57_003747 [Natronocella acetinitrilica]|jgi:hypothetical protein|uniref:Uncharacterized protein n=1 Tax=Natronocella acetinitrilica TaxID=414046 RepID=A0AAE3G679_9GAMM|nr:DUF6489 family protein [Natronocella acetinitrilica]MCP1676576.1 hypothetical protein [Natronocella acetinitrilica]